MKPTTTARHVLTTAIAAALLAGCGGLQGLAPGAMQQAVSRSASHTKQELIYVMSAKNTYIIAYDDGSLVGSFSQTDGYAGLCSDAEGNVFMPHRNSVLEFAHSGTMPIAQLSDGDFRPLGCSVDPTTGDLAVANIDSSTKSGQGPGSIAIFKNASGNPTFYSDGRITNYFSCSYDGSGNLFLDGRNDSDPFIFAELPKGSDTFQLYSLDKTVTSPGSVQWDGRYIAVGADGARLIYRVKVSGSVATIVGTTRLYDKAKATFNFTFWLQNGTLLTAAGPHRGGVGLWRYPRGRKITALYHVLRQGELGGLTVSVAPSR